MSSVEIDGRELWLGRLEADDPRDVNHRMSAVLLDEVAPRPRYWRTGQVLDQGKTNSCVGFACRQWLQTAPIMYKSAMPSGLDIYKHALTVDEWPGEQDTGTSIRAGLKALQDMGHVERYVWAYSSEEVKQWIIQFGSVIVGTQVTEGMVKPFIDNRGEVWMRPTGRELSGHAYLLAGYSYSRRAYRKVGSWTRSWGDNGRAWIAESDFNDLLHSHGDAVGVIEKKV